MILETAERANLDDNIANAAKLISKSKHRRAVFEAIYFGRKEWKSATEIAKRIGIRRKRVVEEGKRIFDHKFAQQRKADNDVWYSRDPILYQNKSKILAAAKNKKKLEAIPTRTRPHIAGAQTVRIVLVGGAKKPKAITVDDVASFKKVRNFKKRDPSLRLNKLAEDRVKRALKSIICESHNFKDWGGEKNDLFTNKLRVTGSRRSAAFALKGKATSGPLTPKKMGKNGDQIGRLFTSEAEVFFVVYHSKVDESIHAAMHAHAVAKSTGGRRIQYGVIDGDDLNRLCQAYKEHFYPT
jgi:hypothetical protein